MIVDDNAERAAAVEQSLTAAGVVVCCLVVNHMAVLHQISEHRPDVIVIDMDSPGRDMLESLTLVTTHSPTPMVMFSREQDATYIQKAVAAGVSTYLIGDVPSEQVRSLIDIALAQFQSFQKLRNELEDTRDALRAREAIDQAKALLIKELDLDERQAYECLRNRAMENRMKISEFAQRMLSHNVESNR